MVSVVQQVCGGQPRTALLAALVVTGAVHAVAARTAAAQAGQPPVRHGLVRRPAAADSTSLTQIRATLDASADAWNRGDLDGFMSSYAPGEGTTFVGRRGLIRGPVEIRATYAPRFAPGAPARGRLHFEQLEVDLLAPDVANAIAYYVLSVRTAAGRDSTIARGPTSLVMRRLGGAWKIVHDHSS